MSMDGHPDFLAGLWVNEEPMGALAGAFLNKAGGLQLSDDFVPRHLQPNRNLSLGFTQIGA